MANVMGCSGSVLSVSNKIREGIATLLLPGDPCISMLRTIDVSKSEAEMVNKSPDVSSKKSSKMGKVAFVPIAPLTVCKVLSKLVADTTKRVIYINKQDEEIIRQNTKSQ